MVQSIVMVNIVPLDRERHSGKGWRPSHGYTFVAKQALVPLTSAEFGAAAVAMPIAFIEQSGRYMPVAVLSLLEGHNFFVGPSGQWLGSYVPAAFRGYPFRLVRGQEKDQMILCIDEDSGWVVDAGANPDAARFFEADGTLSAATQATANFLQQVEQSRVLTDVAVTALAEAHVIKPWSLTVKEGDHQKEIKGLHYIDEAALNALDDATFLKLRHSLALAIAHGQLISMHTLGVLQQLHILQQQLIQKTQPPSSISSLLATDDGGIIRFN